MIGGVGRHGDALFCSLGDCMDREEVIGKTVAALVLLGEECNYDTNLMRLLSFNVAQNLSSLPLLRLQGPSRQGRIWAG